MPDARMGMREKERGYWRAGAGTAAAAGGALVEGTTVAVGAGVDRPAAGTAVPGVAAAVDVGAAFLPFFFLRFFAAMAAASVDADTTPHSISSRQTDSDTARFMALAAIVIACTCSPVQAPASVTRRWAGKGVGPGCPS